MKKVTVKINYDGKSRSASANVSDNMVNDAKKAIKSKLTDFLCEKYSYVDNSERMFSDANYIFSKEYRESQKIGDMINNIIENSVVTIETL